MSDPFTVLGLPPTASVDEIKARYRRLAHTHHPDSGPTGSSARMAELNRAYEELTRDLEGCRRRARDHRTSSSRRRQPVHPSPPPTSASRAMQWKEWLNTARRTTTRSEPGRRSRPRTATPIRITPSVLTICREHGPAELHVKGPEASTSSVLFCPRFFDVARAKFSAGDQVFSVRLTGQFPERESDAFLTVRNGQVVRRVPVYEFSCPTSEGSCAFAS